MELRHLRCFIAVAEELHFARAAERLHIEQSPLSRTIKELEEDLGAQLFVRTSRSTRLTRAGQLFLDHVPRIFTALQQARDSVKAAANGYHGQLRVALSDGISPSRFSTFLALCRQEEPEIGIRLSEVPLAQQIKGLHDDLYDVGFARSDEVGDGIVAEAVWNDPLMVAVPARHPLLTHKRLPLEEVLRYPLVLADPHACEGYARQIERLLRQVDQEPLIAERVASTDLMMALAVDGVYRTDHHLAVAQGQATPDRDPRELVAAHVRRLEALRRGGIVEREAEGVWHVPGDLAQRGREYDAQRLGGGVAVELKSHLPIERQARVIGATWLDQQLIGGGKGLGDLGFGAEVKDALRERADFLAEQCLAEQRGQRVLLARNLLATLRGRELAKAAQDIASETGLEHRPVADGQRVAGIYRRSVMLASGRYAMLDNGMGFSLVPWKPVIEQRLSQQLAATVRGGGVSWEIGRRRGLHL